MQKQMNYKYYYLLLIMVAVYFILMYFLMYAMVNSFNNIVHNYNQIFMAVLMASPMVVIELTFMGIMYQKKKLNFVMIGVSVVIFFLSFVFIRQQTAISDKQLLRSMIPHDAAAILMCEKASIEDPELAQMVESMIQDYQSEIDQMKMMLAEMEKQ